MKGKYPVEKIQNHLKKAFGKIVFEPIEHKYTVDGKVFPSVSKLKAAVGGGFNANYWSLYKALQFSGYTVKKGTSETSILVNGEYTDIDVAKDLPMSVTVDEVRAEWNHKAARGTSVHYYLEKGFFDSFPPKRIDFLDTYVEKLKTKFIPVQMEIVLAHFLLEYCGTLDFLCMDVQGRFYIRDFKTDKNFTIKNPWQKMIEPFQDWDNCKLNVYTIQLNLYKYAIEKATKIKIHGMAIDHFNIMKENEDGTVNPNYGKHTEYQVPLINLNDEIIRRIKYAA